METQVTTTSPAETEALGVRIAALLRGSETMLLIGELGAGKTALVRGIARGLGITEPVRSPTYTYLREYQVPRRSTRLAHFDLYRMPVPMPADSVTALEVVELTETVDVISVVEWPERLPLLLERPALSITIEEAADPQHRVLILPHKLSVARHA